MPTAQVIPFSQRPSPEQRIRNLLSEATPAQPNIVERLSVIENQLSEVLSRLPLEGGSHDC